jgi:hypothetical protein
VGAVLLLLGTVAGVLLREVLDADRFSAHVDAVRSDPAVSRRLGEVVTDRILASQPDLTAVRPLLESTATSVVASPTLSPAVRATAVGPLYRTLSDGGDSTLVVRLADVAAIALGVVNLVAPEQRAAVPAEVDLRLSRLGSGGGVGEPLWWVHLVRWLSWFLPLLGLLVLAVSGATLGAAGPGRRSRVWGALGGVGRGALGAGLGLAGVLVLVGFAIGRADAATLSGAVVRAVWGELDGEFWAAAGLLGAVGYVLTLLARPGRARLSRDVSARQLAAHAWGQVLDPGPGLGARAYRAGFVLVTGVALVLQPLELLRALLWAAGAVFVVTGLYLLVPITLEAVREKGLHRLPDPGRPGVRPQTVAAGAVVLALVALLLVGGWPASEDESVAFGQDSHTCNGYAALCDRPYDQIAFPATHNSMAAADEPGWFFAEQPDGIVAQLDHGIRVLLIDSWYAQRTQRAGVVANTDQSRAEALRRGPGVVRRGGAAQRAAGPRRPEPDPSRPGRALPVPRPVRAGLHQVASGDEAGPYVAGVPPT